MAAGTTSDSTAGAVRAELARRRLLGRDLAAGLGWSTSTTARRLRGELPFTVDELIAVARYLGVPLATLLPTDEQVPA